MSRGRNQWRGPALAALVDERHHVLVLGVVVHVVVLGEGLRVAPRLRMRREVVDHLAGAEDAAAIADRLEELLAGADHEDTVIPAPLTGAKRDVRLRPRRDALLLNGRRVRMSTHVIRRKVAVPPPPPRFVPRKRIDCLLSGLVEAHPLVWVCATAGAGKTTAVAQALAGLERHVAWLTLDDTDAAAGRLVTYLEAAIGAHLAAARAWRRAPSPRAYPTPRPPACSPRRSATRRLSWSSTRSSGLPRRAEALAVVAALVRYAPPAMRVVLVSRREADVALGSAAALGGTVTVTDSDLAFRPVEAAAALAHAGRADIDPARAVEATGGWVAGVLFEAWRSSEHVTGMGGEADALHGYLSSQILSQLPAKDREFLVTTAVLDDVTAERAEAVGHPDAAARLASLRARHLPVSWRDESHAMRCHPRLREYLLERLARRGAAEVRAVRAAHAELLLSEGHDEDAVEEFLRARMPARASPAAERAIERVIDRLDYAVAERWLAALDGIADGSTFAVAEMMLALGREDYARCGRVADRLHMVAERQRLARASQRAAGMMGWSYWHLGRWRDARRSRRPRATGPRSRRSASH